MESRPRKKTMNLICAVLFFSAVVEICWGLPTDVLRRRRLARKLDIINGTTVKITDYPFAASVRTQGLLSGAGVVINNNWILTSADSVFDVDPSAITVRVGSQEWSLNGQDIPAQEIVVHEKYAWQAVDYNIALIKLNETIKFGKKVKPATLGTNPLKDGTAVTVVGWGETTQSSSQYPASEYLLAANLTTINKKKCESAIKTKLNTGFCTSFDHGGPCEYDTGDPLVHGGVLYGLYTTSADSVEIQCAPGIPGINTDITQFLPWIQSHIS